MPKSNKSLIILLLLLSQSILALLLGLFALYSLQRGHILPNIYVDSQYIGSMTKDQAIGTIENYYNSLSDDKELHIKWSDGEYSINLGDINAVIDYDATVDQALVINGEENIVNLIRGHFTKKDRKSVIYPVVRFEDEKLRDKIKELSMMVNKPPVDAKAYLKEGSLEKDAERIGTKLNVENTYKKIRDQFGRYLNTSITLEYGANNDITKVMPQTTLKELDGVNTVISEFSTRIKYPEMEENIMKAASSIDGVEIRGRCSEEFSFYNHLIGHGLDDNPVYNEYSQVASTIYGALLKAGISVEVIKRNRNDTQVDYAEPGLDVKFEGEECDFKFKNTLSSSIILFAKVEHGNLQVYIAGSKKDASIQRDIRIREIQRFEPSLYSEVSYDLKPGEKKVVSYGREGIEVEVYRVSKKNGEENEELLYSNKYNAVAGFIQVGPAYSMKTSIIK